MSDVINEAESTDAVNDTESSEVMSSVRRKVLTEKSKKDSGADKLVLTASLRVDENDGAALTSAPEMPEEPKSKVEKSGADDTSKTKDSDVKGSKAETKETSGPKKLKLNKFDVDPASDKSTDEAGAASDSADDPAEKAVGNDENTKATTDDRDILTSESPIDEEMLRDMISDIVRQELQGALGEKITRNVRKLVRREINRVMMSNDME